MVRISIYAWSCFLIFQTAIGAANDFAANQSRAADAIEKFSAQDIKLILYSIDPDFRHRQIQNPANFFYGYNFGYGFPVLGKVEITSPEEKKILLSAFAKGIRGEDGTPSDDCLFQPRHGLRIIYKSNTNDFAICFTCGDVAAYGFGPAKTLKTGNSSKAAFDKILDEYKLPEAK